jgi:hypothetical protein
MDENSQQNLTWHLPTILARCQTTASDADMIQKKNTQKMLVPIIISTGTLSQIIKKPLRNEGSSL